MEKIRFGLLETIVELNELLDLSKALGLSAQEEKLGNMINHVTDAINYLDKEDIHYLKVNDGTLYVKCGNSEFSYGKKLYLSKTDVSLLYSTNGYIYAASPDGEQIKLTKDEVLECF